MSSSSAAAAAAAGAAAATVAAASSPKICFNKYCKEPITEPPRRRGWRLRSGELADLCDRCSSTYEQGSLCETFHSDGDGWRKCESCGKRVHCGCIVSVATFMLLDAGGIECIACARKHYIMIKNKKSTACRADFCRNVTQSNWPCCQLPDQSETKIAPNQIWPSSVLLPLPPERLKELSVKSWSQLTATSPVPGKWRQSPNMWSTSTAHSELHQRLSLEFDRPNGTDRLISGGRFTLPPQDKKKIEDLPERLTSNNLIRAGPDRIVNGNTAFESAFNTFNREEGNVDGLQDSGHLVVETDPIATRKGVISDPCLNSSAGSNFEAHPNSCVNISLPSSIIKDDPSAPLIGLAAPFPPPNDANDPVRGSTTQTHRQTTSASFAKQFYPISHNPPDSSAELQTQIRNGRPRSEGRGRNQLLPRYWPRITDQELQQISGDSNSVITPLFEKMLSASDAGRIGRLVLPKKCAEAYFPAISQPEGLPLKVQDARGKEWVFQFRFWPNNNSRMYVLEGVTPCIQSMQLQAGDTVTFSRIDPEGKLVMGFRKASNISTEQDMQALKAGNGYSTTQEVNNRNGKPSEIIPSPPLRPFRGSAESMNPSNPSDQTTWSKFDKTGFIQKEGTASKSSVPPSKRKNSILGSKSKRLRIENEDSIELKLTWEEAQELLRPPPNHSPSVVVIEGHEFEEYEEPPVLGKPTIFTTSQAGEKNQWAQCEDCSKWRKLPVDALLPPRWTCSDNSRDPERSSCSSAQEISTQQLADLLPSNSVPSKKSKAKVEINSVEASGGLDTLANLAILGEGESLPPSSQPTTKHPRHRPGCTCIVCIQPPSGKGPKHKQTCQCNVCLTVKRRFRTLMLRKEKRQSEKQAEAARKKQQQQIPSPEMLSQREGDPPTTSKTFSSETQKLVVTNGGVVDEDSDRRKALPSIKTQIDLNIQPEREEEPSPVSDTGSTMRLLRDATA